VWDLTSSSRWIWRWRSPAVDALFSSRKVPTLPINPLPYGSVYLLPWIGFLPKFSYTLPECTVGHNTNLQPIGNIISRTI
jgi:hypothetical protein